MRADGTVVELQHSPIDPATIADRERAYGVDSLVWLFDGRDIRDDHLELRDRGDYVSFRWKHPRKTYGCCRACVFIDLGTQVLALRRLHLDGPPYGGWGYLEPHAAFVSWLTEGAAATRASA